MSYITDIFKKKPKPKPEPGEPMPATLFNCTVTHGGEASVKIILDTAVECIGKEDGAGSGRFGIMVPDHQTSGGDIVIEKEGYFPIRHRLMDAQGNEYTLGVPNDGGSHEIMSETLIALKPPIINLPRLVVVGQFLRTENNQFHCVKECSDFNMLNRFHSGEDIHPVLEQRGALFNTLRVWTAYDIPKIGRLQPTPELYASIPPFLDDCSRYSLYVELTVFTGPYPWFTTKQQFVDHYNNIVAACQGKTNVRIELINEYVNAPNLGVPLELMHKPNGVMSAHGSSIADDLPLRPIWDYEAFHPSGPEWQRKVGKQAYDIATVSGVAVVSNETARCPDNESNTLHYHDAMAGAALLCAGACFHSVNGKTSTLWSGVELDCAKAASQGFNSVPLQYQQGQYVRRDDLLVPGVIRVYGRILPEGEWDVVIHE